MFGVRVFGSFIFENQPSHISGCSCWILDAVSVVSLLTFDPVPLSHTHCVCVVCVWVIHLIVPPHPPSPPGHPASHHGPLAGSQPAIRF